MSHDNVVLLFIDAVIILLLLLLLFGAAFWVSMISFSVILMVFGSYSDIKQ